MEAGGAAKRYGAATRGQERREEALAMPVGSPMRVCLRYRLYELDGRLPFTDVLSSIAAAHGHHAHARSPRVNVQPRHARLAHIAASPRRQHARPLPAHASPIAVRYAAMPCFVVQPNSSEATPRHHGLSRRIRCCRRPSPCLLISSPLIRAITGDVELYVTSFVAFSAVV